MAFFKDEPYDYRENFDRDTNRIMQKARTWAREKGESFVVFVGSFPTRAFRSQDNAVEFGREVRASGVPKVSIKRVRV